MTGVAQRVWNTLTRRGVEKDVVRPPVIRTPQTTDLTALVGTIMRPTLTVDASDSLARAAGLLRENGSSALPVLDEAGRLQGVLTDRGLARALAEMSEPGDAVGTFAEEALVLAPYASAAEALRRGEDGRTRVVIDDSRRVVGLVSAVDLWPRRRTLPRPVAVGGMATPFGVYLTTGSVSAGAPWWALMTTGASMMLMLLGGIVLSDAAARAGFPALYAPFLALGLFFLLMRLMPLSGTHGAEHQVVHAIEREEMLTAEVVSRMPRVHPRCGTNLMVGLGLFLGIQGIPWAAANGGAAIGALVAIVFALPLGAIAQRYVTTKRPSDRQLAGAIRAGEALLLRNATAGQIRPTPLRRIWSMGLLQVMAGATLMVFLLKGIGQATGWSWIPDLTR